MLARPLRIVVVSSILAGAPLLAQPPGGDPCDPGLLSRATGPDKYERRGDRCEGLYAREVAGAALAVVSFTSAFDAFDPAAIKSLRLDWPAPRSGVTRLRAVALRPRLYYRMDAVRPPAIGSDQWPTTFLSRLKLSRDELGVLAWTRAAVGTTERDVLLGLRVHSNTTTSPTGAYRLVVVPGGELKELFVTMVLEGSTSPAAFVMKDKPLGFNYYPADRGIVITLPAPRTSGVYRVELGAELKDGGAATAQIWFNHSTE
jgi:hypothetical protein